MTARSFNLVMAAACAAAFAFAGWLYAVKGAMLPCVFRSVTGWSCPGCGSQRAAHALLHGNVTEAVGYNLMLPPLLVYCAAVAVTGVGRGERMRVWNRRLTSAPVAFAVVVLMAVWTVIRNVLEI